MAQNYKIRNMLKNSPFYSDKINKIKKIFFIPQNITITPFILKNNHIFNYI